MNVLNNGYNGFDNWEFHHSHTNTNDVQHPITVYIKSPADVSEHSHYFVQRPMFYIGSTKVGVCHREYNRHTQLNRYKQGRAIQVEISNSMVGPVKNNYSQFFHNCCETFRHIRRSLDI